MNRQPLDPLANLLRRAEDDPGVVRAASDLAHRARVKHRRNARRRIVATSVGSVGLVLLVGVTFTGRFRTQLAGLFQDRPVPTTPVVESSKSSQVEVARLRDELDALHVEAVVYEREVVELKRVRAAEEQIRRAKEALVRAEAPDPVESARQRAAMMLLRDAEQAAATPGKESAADESYRRAARLFPDTPAGRLAAGRLKTPVGSIWNFLGAS